MENIKLVSINEIKKSYPDEERAMDKLQNMINQLSNLNDKCSNNMKQLNNMMLELKGIVAVIRPQVKKTGWYGEEIEGKIKSKECPPLEIEVKCYEK